jgi:hypothetical protein
MNNRSRHLGFESLERRALLSGVTAVVTNGELTLAGLSGSNSVALTAGTTRGVINAVINGGAVQSYSGVKGVSVRLLGGNNVLTVGSLTTPGVTLSLGLTVVVSGGGNQVTTDRLATTLVGIQTTGSNNSIVLDDTAAAAATINMGSGTADTLALNTSAISAGVLTGGGGAGDTLTTTSSHIAPGVTISGFQVVAAPTPSPMIPASLLVELTSPSNG